MRLLSWSPAPPRRTVPARSRHHRLPGRARREFADARAGRGPDRLRRRGDRRARRAVAVSVGGVEVQANRTAVEEHWRASERSDSATEHAIYADDALLEYQQSGERFRGRTKIAAQREGHPADRHFTVLRIIGVDDLWVSEVVISYDGVPTFSV